MEKLPRILEYFTGKIWDFLFRRRTLSELKLEALVKAEHWCRVTVDRAIEGAASISEALASSEEYRDLAQAQDKK